MRAIFEQKSNRHMFLSASGRFVYHLGIIDYLQNFNFEKVMENRFKTMVYKHGAEISAIAPKQYGDRFL